MKDLYAIYLKRILKPYIQSKKFLLIVDSNGGQTGDVYNEIFTGRNDNENFKFKIKWYNHAMYTFTDK